MFLGIEIQFGIKLSVLSTIVRKNIKIKLSIRKLYSLREIDIRKP